MRHFIKIHRSSIPAIFAVLVVTLSVAALSAADRAPRATDAASVSINGVPHVQQKPDFCGEACVASWLQKLGSTADQDDVFNASGLDPTLARGCYTKELATALKKIGFDIGPVWNRISVADKDQQLGAVWSATLNDLGDGVPSIVCMRTSDGANATEHFRLVLGYDATTDEVIYHEPAVADGAYQRMPRSELLNLWPLKYDTRQWLAIRFALRSSGVPSLSASPGHTAADYAQHIMRLNSRLPNKSFTILIQHPFVVIGDEESDVVRQRAENTIKWATDKLKADYFSSDPNQILDIWLFKDKESYETHSLRLFGSQPSTPYGYYSSGQAALVMNIATGGGTLVHEIVHPFMEANFPNCPAWFNEGLGSLYEQSRERDGKIVGLTNWRLAGLQTAIKRGDVPPFKTLCATSNHQFYRADPGTNYAQARYLCYYLQEQGLLHKFYHRFVNDQKTDPTGYETLMETLGVDDMDEFKTSWEKFVMSLRFN